VLAYPGVFVIRLANQPTTSSTENNQTVKAPERNVDDDNDDDEWI